MPEGYAECGRTAADTGWPTTTTGSPYQADCLMAALGAGTAAAEVITGRDTEGGAIVVVYLADPGGTLRVLVHHIDPAGAADTEERACATPQPGMWFLGLEGHFWDGEVDLCAAG